MLQDLSAKKAQKVPCMHPCCVLTEPKQGLLNSWPTKMAEVLGFYKVGFREPFRYFAQRALASFQTLCSRPVRRLMIRNKPSFKGGFGTLNNGPQMVGFP